MDECVRETGGGTWVVNVITDMQVTRMSKCVDAYSVRETKNVRRRGQTRDVHVIHGHARVEMHLTEVTLTEDAKGLF